MIEYFFLLSKIVINDSLVDLTWQGKRLTNIAADNKYYYNHSGIRIKKETPDEITTYELEGTNIISMSKVVGENSYRLDFTYDSNNQLVGLTTEEGEYFYIRDITNDIVGLIDSNGNFVVKYEYDVWGNVLNVEKSIPSCIAANHNPFKYKGYYYDDETGLFMVGHRYYNPEWGRWLSPDDIEYLVPHSINGLNLYAYCNNDSINMVDSSGHYAVPSHKGYNNHSSYVPIVPNPTVKIPRNLLSNPLSFSIGLVTPENYDMPSWMSTYAFYVKGSIGWGYTFGEGYSLASFSMGVLDATFNTPKWFNSLSDDCLVNPNIYLGVGALNINASVGAGVSGTAEIVSGTVGIQFGDSVSVSAKGYVGIGFTLDFTNGIKFGAGLGLGYEISLNIDWYELFH